MTLKTLQNFYKAIVTDAFDAGTLKMYIDTLPTPTVGYVVINPSNAIKREIVLYSAIGTDGGGNYLTLTTRGLGGTTDQSHDINEPVRMNITAEHYAEIQDEIQVVQDELDAAILAGAGHASTTNEGITKLSVAPASATEPIAVGDNDPRVPTADPDTIYVREDELINTSAGAGDEGKVPKLNADGVLDSSFTKPPEITTYTAGATWSKDSTLKYIIVELVGSGGGGEAGEASTSGEDDTGAGGVLVGILKKLY